MEICWVLSNIVTTNTTIMGRFPLIDKLLSMLESDALEVRREIAIIFANLICSAEPSSVFTLYTNRNMIKRYVDILKLHD